MPWYHGVRFLFSFFPPSLCAFSGAAVLKAVVCFSEKSIATHGWKVPYACIELLNDHRSWFGWTSFLLSRDANGCELPFLFLSCAAFVD